jgi:hypothetical protein
MSATDSSNSLTPGVAGSPSLEAKAPSFAQQGEGSGPVAALMAFGRGCAMATSEAALIQEVGAAVAAVLHPKLFGLAELIRLGALVRLTVMAVGDPGGTVTHENSTQTTRSGAAFALAAGLPVVSVDLAQEARYSDPLLSSLGVRAALTVPFFAAGKPLGALGVYHRRPGEFSPADIEFAQHVGHLLGPTLSRMRMEQELVKLEGRLQGMREPGPGGAGARERLGAAPGGPGKQDAGRSQPPAPAKESRRAQRQTFGYWQRIAPTIGWILPAEEEFFDVLCKDISACGIAFYADRPPDFNTLAVELGCRPKQSHFFAQVVRVAKVDRDGQKCYVVGCRFMGKV